MAEPALDARPPSPGRIDISLRTLLLTALVVGGAWVFIKLIPIFLVVVGALIFAGTLDPAVQWLERHRLKRPLALALVFGVSLLVLAGLVLLLMPPLWQQLGEFAAQAPKLQHDLAGWLGSSKVLSPASEWVKSLDPKKLVASESATSNLLSLSGGFVETGGYVVSSLVLALYLVADRERARGSLFAVVPRRHHVKLARILLNLQTIVGGYMRGQLITSAAIFGFTLALLAACQTPGALALAVFAGLTDIIPFIGGLLATSPAFLATLAVSPWKGVLVLVAMLLYQEFESRILVPRIYGKTLRLSSAAVIIALLVGGKLLGILGALLALPVAAGMRMVFLELRVELPGDDSSNTVTEALDAEAEREYAQQSEGAAPEQAAAVAGKIADEALQVEAAAKPSD